MRYLVIFMLLSLSACGSSPTTAAIPSALVVTPVAASTAPPQAPSSDAILIVLQRTGGVAGRKETTTIMDGGAILTEKGPSNVAHSQASAQATTALMQKIADTGIYKLAPGNYIPKGECCDHFNYDLTLSDQGKQYHYLMSDSASLPPELANVLGLITGYVAAGQPVS